MAEVGEKKVEAEEGSELHENAHVYKNGGNPEQLASDPPMIHKTIVVHEQEEDLEVSTNNFEGNHEGEDLEVPNKLEGHHKVIPPFLKEGRVKTTMKFLHEKKERRIQIINIVLRSIGVLFSFISFVIMASDDHGSYDYQSYDDYTSFHNFEAYRFCLAMGVIAFVYLVLQLGKGIYVTFFNSNLFRHVAFSYVDFIGDQLMAYLLMSSASSAGSITRSLKELGFSGKMVDLPAASLSMSFIAFASVATSSVFSAFALAKHILL